MEVVGPEVARLAKRRVVDEAVLRGVVQDDVERGVRVPNAVSHLEECEDVRYAACRPALHNATRLTPQWLEANDWARAASFEL